MILSENSLPVSSGSYMGFMSREVSIGPLLMGGDQPIRIQSMVNTSTMDTAATVRQIIELHEAGCELVRVTAQNLREAHNLSAIKKELTGKKIHIPLAADIHFLPEAAEVAARIVEKVRINPGNYSEKRKDAGRSYSPAEYEEELERIAARLRPLLGVCRQYGTALRIGTNHGSLSQRIVDRYGNTPEGMAESAMEFLRICRFEGFRSIVLSMKASNILTVIHSNRLLVKKMMEEGMDYPIHLGVTEAGEGEDGRIKSAAGIGILLAEGIGDTIRVSLTEDPVREIPFAARLAAWFNEADRRLGPGIMPPALHPFVYQRVKTVQTDTLGGSFPPEVVHPQAELPNVRKLEVSGQRPGVSGRLKMAGLTAENGHSPILLHADMGNLSGDDLLIKASIDLAMPLTDGLGDAVMITGGKGLSETEREQLAYDILQATGRRITRTEYISCPSCGRTQFNIQQALKTVKEKTAHLVGLKIAVMGCVVNGPGEMADADYGYVGAGPGKVHIYKGQSLVRRNVNENEAIEALLNLIRENTP